MADLDFPPFLRECDNFPLPPDNHYGPYKKREFELDVSLDTLLETQDAAELLFGLLMGPGNRLKERTYIWLSHNMYISDLLRAENRICGFTIHDSDQPKFFNNFVSICITPSADIEQQCVVVDTCLRLLAKHKTISYLLIERADIAISGPFPASLDALKALVNEAQSPRKIQLSESIGFSVDQWRVFAFDCNSKTATICYTAVSFHPGMEILIDAMKCKQCPAQLSLMLHVYCFPKEMFVPVVVSALETTNTLNYLELLEIQNSSLVPYCEAIAKNHGLQRVKLKSSYPCCPNQLGWTVTDTEWEIICSVIASHPTLKRIKFHGHFVKESRSPERDQIFIDRVSHNSVLCDFTYKYPDLFHDPNHVEQTLRPILKVNRFRTVVQAIKEATDVTERQHLFTSIIRSGFVTKCPAFRFWLLKENPDLMLELLLGQTKIGCSQHAGIVP